MCQAARIIIKRRNHKAPVPDGPPPHLLWPTARDYFVEWFEDLGSPWNLCSREILVDYVLAAFPDDTNEEDRPKIQKAVLTHLQALRDVYLTSKPPQERAILARRHKRIQRKREVRWFSSRRRRNLITTKQHVQKLNRRLDVVRDPAFPTLQGHAFVYETLGVDGMSSEEDCPGPCLPGKEPTRLVYKKAYLSADLSNFNVHVDSIHERRWGARPYFRSSPVPKACPRWIPKLPRNVYDQKSLASLKSHQKASLQIRPDHQLTFHTGPV